MAFQRMNNIKRLRPNLATNNFLCSDVVSGRTASFLFGEQQLQKKAVTLLYHRAFFWTAELHIYFFAADFFTVTAFTAPAFARGFALAFDRLILVFLSNVVVQVNKREAAQRESRFQVPSTDNLFHHIECPFASKLQRCQVFSGECRCDLE